MSKEINRRDFLKFTAAVIGPLVVPEIIPKLAEAAAKPTDGGARNEEELNNLLKQEIEKVISLFEVKYGGITLKYYVEISRNSLYIVYEVDNDVDLECKALGRSFKINGRRVKPEIVVYQGNWNTQHPISKNTSKTVNFTTQAEAGKEKAVISFQTINTDRYSCYIPKAGGTGYVTSKVNPDGSVEFIMGLGSGFKLEVPTGQGKIEAAIVRDLNPLTGDYTSPAEDEWVEAGKPLFNDGISNIEGLGYVVFRIWK